MIVETPQQFLEAKREAITRVRYYVELAANKLGIRIEYPQVLFGLNGRTGGTASAAKNLIQFNPTLLRENAEHFLRQTVGHEVAHLIQRNQWPDSKPHGVEWQRVMHGFNLPADRCHSYDTRHVPSQFGNLRRTSQIPQNNSNERKIECGRVVEF